MDSAISNPKSNAGDSLPPSETPAIEEDHETASGSKEPNEKDPVPIESPSPNFDANGVGDAKDEILNGGPSEEMVNSGGGGEKDEILGGGSNRDAPNSVVEVEGELKDGGLAQDEAKAVEIEFPFVEDEKKDESFDGSEKTEVEATSPVFEGEEKGESRPEGSVSGVEVAQDENERKEDVKPVGTEVVVEENRVSLAQNEEKGKGLESEVVEKIPVFEEKIVLEHAAEVEKNLATDDVFGQNLEVAVEDMKPVEVEGNTEKNDGVAEPEAVREEKDERIIDVVDASVESKAEEDASNSSSPKIVEGVVDDSKNVEVEPNAANAEELDGKVDAKAVEEEKDVVDVSVESKDVEEEANADVAEKSGVTKSFDADKADELDPVEKDIGIVAADKNEVVAGVDMETEEEKVTMNSGQVSTDLEANRSDDDGVINTSQDMEPPPVSANDSETKESETEAVENSGSLENGTACGFYAQSTLPVSDPVKDIEDNEDENPTQNEGGGEEDDEDNISDEQPRVAILDSSETAKQIIKELEEASSSAASFESSRSYQNQMDGQIVSDSDEEVDTDEEGDGKELFDSAALAALLKAATGGSSSDGNITITSQDGTRVFSMDRPAGLGSSAPSLRPGPTRGTRPTLFSPSELAVTAEPETEMNEEERKLHEKVEGIRVKFLRLVMRLGHTPEDTVAAQVLYRLSLAEGIKRGRQMGRGFSIETAKKKAIQLEAEGEENLKFSCNILVLGKTGVGKSATMNSIFGEEKSQTSPFQTATTSVREISGVVDGVKIRVIDTPGLKPSVMDQATNRKILSSVKKYMKKCPPDIVLYVDRLDTQTRDFNDLPMLKSIMSTLGSSIWFNAIVALTHSASAPPEGPNGSPLSYEVFIAQRSHVVQHSIRQAAGDMRLMNPVALVENHPSCRRNRDGERVLPNGISWRPQLLLLCYSSKILSEANSLLKLQDPSPGKLFGFRMRSPPLPYLLSTLLQSRPHPKLPNDQGGDNADSDIDLDDFSDTEVEEEDEYDQLPPFKPLKKSQLAKLTKEQKRAYFDEYDYRVKLLQKKQFKEEIRRLKEMKKRGKNGKGDSPYNETGEDFDQDNAPAAVPVPLPDMVLPPSFDCDVPTYRYRFLEPTSQLLTRPVLDTHGWDHDCGYDGVSIEETLALANKFPAAIAVQITKDKKDFNIHLDSSIAAKHGVDGSSLAGFDIQSVGKQLAYILRGETKFKNLKKNKTAAGVSVTFLGETVATGLKIEDQLTIGKRVSLVASTGAVRAQGDVAYGANLEARLREKDYPIGQAVSTLGLSLMKWRGDLALGANLQSQVNVGRNTKVAVRVGLNNKRSGQITIRTSSSEQLQLALVAIIPVAASIFRTIWPGENEYGH